MTLLQIGLAIAAFDAGFLVLLVCFPGREQSQDDEAPRPKWLPMSPDQVAAEVDLLRALWDASPAAHDDHPAAPASDAQSPAQGRSGRLPESGATGA